MTHRITFNKPATDTYLETADAIVFRFSGEEISFRMVDDGRSYIAATNTNHENVVSLRENGRQIIEGVVTPELAERLGGTRQFPYYVIPDTKTSDDTPTPWRVMVPFRTKNTPQKHHAWMRLWMPYDPKIAEPLSDDITEMFGEFITTVRMAKARLDAAPRGRPTKEIEEARRIIGAFRRFAAEIGMCGEDEAVVEEAITLLRSILPSGRNEVIRLELDDAVSG